MTRRPLPLLTLALAACVGDGEPVVNSPSGDGAATPVPADWVITGGTVVDGSGAPGRTADVVLRDGRIAFIGDLDPDTIAAAERFDATGLVVAPGFIDAHAHGDPVGDPAFPNFLAMGVTTIVLGQDGGSPRAESFAAHLDSVAAARPDVNVAYLVGHNTIRRESGVEFGDPGSEGLVRMSELVARALEAGAFGLSTGLEYDPGSRSEMAELVAIAEPVAAANAVISSHLRSEDADVVEEALAELLEQGRRTGARIHASHLKIVLGSDTSQAVALLETMRQARAEGLRVTADVYPYTASYTGIGLLFPDWAKPPNEYATVLESRRADLATHLRERVMGRNGPEATLFGSGEFAGRTLAEVATEQGRPFEDVLIDIGPDGTSAAYFVMNEGVMRRLLADPHVAVSSDGSPTMQHPRGHGAFARVIRQFVMEEEMLTLEEAVRKMSGFTASIYGLDDSTRVGRTRGRLMEGAAADVAVFDPAAVHDPADFEQPHRLAEGMRAVWVNGTLAWRDGEPVLDAGEGAGRAVRARASAAADRD